MNISLFDFSIIACYFVVIFIITVRIGRKVSDSNDYFLAGRSMRWPMIGASLFATNISAEQFVGQAGLAVAIGIAVANYQLAGVLGFALMGLIFLPTFIRLGITTAPQFLEIRYGTESRKFLSIITILFIGLNAVPLSLYAGGQVMRDMFGWDSIVPGILILCVTTGLYAVIGGLKAVVVTDFMQMFILVIGGFLVLGFGLHAVGGVGAFLGKMDAIKASGGEDLMSLFRPANHPIIPWTGVVFGLTVHSFYYCSMNHTIVQRAMAAKSIHQGRMGGLFAALLKALTVFIIVMPGIVGLVLLKDGFFTTPPETEDQIYSAMVRSLLPSGLIGITLSGLVAALMSSVDSNICSASSLITLDWYQPARPNASEKELVKVGRVVGALIIIMGMFWALWVIPHFKFLFDYLAKFNSYSVGGLLACFIGGLVSPYPNRKAGFWTLVIGSFLGLFLWLVADNSAIGAWAHSVGLGFLDMHFLHAAVFLTVLGFVLLFAITFLTKGDGRESFAEMKSTRLMGMEPTTAENKQFKLWLGIVAVVYVGIYLMFM
ncbi:MAG: sodium/solute symporter [Verrucomicrobia bacterium]|nr:sodium/solute symporter [Verrucomicrobiota bacterium]MDA1065225.1 sodium/solute symporter [Verrucomicrobiota bacterium]